MLRRRNRILLSAFLAVTAFYWNDGEEGGASGQSADTAVLTADEDEKELLEQHGHPNKPAPNPLSEKEEHEQEKTTGEEKEPAEQTPAAGGDPDRPADGTTGNADESAVSVAAGGAKPATETPAQPSYQPDPEQFKADAIVQRLDSAIEKIEKNEILEDYERDTKIAALLEQKETRIAKLSDNVQKDEDRTRNAKAAELGLTRAQLDTAWVEACAESKKALGRDSFDAAMMLLNQKATAIKTGSAKPKPKGQAVKPPVSAPVGNIKIAPPANQPKVPVQKDESEEDELVRKVRKIPGGIKG